MLNSEAKSFTVYRNESGAVRVVKNGFSWPAFFLNIYWALFKRLWWLAMAIVTCVLAALVIVESVIAASTQVMVILVIGELGGLTYIGLHANRWLSLSLERRGFQSGEIINAASHSAATRVVGET